jgi:hypothetical protein
MFPEFKGLIYLRDSVAEPDQGSGVFGPLDPGSRIEKNGSGMNIQNYFSENLETVFGVKNISIL